MAYEDGNETYKNIKVGNKAVTQSMEDIGGAISRLKGLRSLTLEGYRMPTAGLKSLQRMPRLVKLRINYIFEDADVVALLKFESLEELELDGTANTGACLPTLAQMP